VICLEEWKLGGGVVKEMPCKHKKKKKTEKWGRGVKCEEEKKEKKDKT
jgi:hypothetical protein